MRVSVHFLSLKDTVSSIFVSININIHILRIISYISFSNFIFQLLQIYNLSRKKQDIKRFSLLSLTESLILNHLLKLGDLFA